MSNLAQQYRHPQVLEEVGEQKGVRLRVNSPGYKSGPSSSLPLPLNNKVLLENICLRRSENVPERLQRHELHVEEWVGINQIEGQGQ